MKFEKFNTNDLKEIEKFLKEADLPVDDIYSSPVNFFGIKNSTDIIAIGALEIYIHTQLFDQSLLSLNFREKVSEKSCLTSLKKKQGN